MRKKSRVVFLQLNEVNFDVIEKYLACGHDLPGFKIIFENGYFHTKSETEYELLEPWIQWPSIHMGLNFHEHNIFRLGDVANTKNEQIFEYAEQLGLKVGAICPMNTINRLKGAPYFVSDPWTNTRTDGSWLLKKVAKAISQVVNDNSHGRLELKSALFLVLGLLSYARLKNITSYLYYALSPNRHKWRKALFLDLFLNDVHYKLWKKNKPDFSSIFLNAFAHVQHHYFHNSKVVDTSENPDWVAPTGSDPILEAVELYDRILLDYISNSECKLVLATGLSQVPFEEKIFYYRLKNHRQFLLNAGLSEFKVMPRMTRDFLIQFQGEDDARSAEAQLSEISVNETEKLFGVVDNRGDSLFVTLTFPREIDETDFIYLQGVKTNLSEQCSFVAIKNGHHNSKGYAYFPLDFAVDDSHNDIKLTDVNVLLKRLLQT